MAQTQKSIELIDDAVVELSGSFITIPKGTKGTEIKIGEDCRGYFTTYIFELPIGFKIQTDHFQSCCSYRYL